MKFKLVMTKDVIEKSLDCGKNGKQDLSNNCAFAVAFKELIPNVQVGLGRTAFFKDQYGARPISAVKQTDEQVDFIKVFDDLGKRGTYEARRGLIGEEFDVEIPDEVIEFYHGDAVKAAQKIANSPVLQIC